ncbi:MAG: B12-binding domain-containing radical SAM protein [Desulfatibacillaceae bacterium]
MKILFIHPRWPKIPEQTTFNLPPLGMIQAAACVPEDVEIAAINENVEEVPLDNDYDVIALSTLLSCQAPRAYELAAEFRKRGKTVIMGGLHPALMPDEAMQHVDALCIGEGEGLVERMVEDIRQGRLEKVYSRPRGEFPDIDSLPNPRRDLHDKKRLYTYKGWELADLVQTSRGCRFNCAPCCVPYLGGRQHRVRPRDQVFRDLDNCGDIVFFVDNSMEQSKRYQLDLFRSLKEYGFREAGKRWISHPVTCNPEVLKAAYESGCWYVYHAIYTVSDKIRDRIKMMHDHGIAVEGTILLGLDDHTEDFILRLVDFLLEIDLDLAEFTVLTPFPRSEYWDTLERENRILHRDWNRYNAANVVFQPKHMSPERLQELYEHAWRSFYEERSQTVRMSELFMDVVKDSIRRRRAMERQIAAKKGDGAAAV